MIQPQPRPAGMAQELYEMVARRPLICPHGHVDPRLFAAADYRFASPTALLLLPDHYILRMLYSQGVPLEALGVPGRDGAPAEVDPRAAWQLFADHWYLFRGTPTSIWLRDELREVFGIDEPLTSAGAQSIYDAIAGRLAQPDFSPRRLYQRFQIAVLATTDAATDTLAHHQAIRDSGWPGRIIPTFRPDAVVDLAAPGWATRIARLSDVSGIDAHDYDGYIAALEARRAFFKAMGATATDHGVLSADTTPLPPTEAAVIFRRALDGTLEEGDAPRFTAHMLQEMARMSSEDGLVMQLHAGALRNHNQPLFQRFGPDMGGDIPVRTEFTRSLRPLLNRFGNHPRLRLILFTLDESAYARELAPLAGHYPALLLGPPWWFHDSPNGIRRYFDQVMETAGLYNTAGFNDDTRAFLSIPARHRLWRRMAAEWVAGLLQRGAISAEDAAEMMVDLADGLARRAYRLD